MKIIITIIFLLTMESAFAHLIVISKKNPLKSLNTAQVKEFFLGEKLRWEDNAAVHVVDYNSNFPLRKVFSDEVIGVSISRVYKTWIRLSLSGNSTPPKILRTEEEVIDFVSADPFAIGYIEKDTGINLKGAKIIKIEN
jgi:ABC-type phosphate transport system substrate-binding protein